MSGKKNLHEGKILYFGLKVCKKNWYEKSQKSQKLLSGSFQHKLGHRDDVCRFSSPVSSNNYGLIFNSVHFSRNCIFGFSAKHPFILR